MVNITQSFLILHFRINCMLPLVILGFPRYFHCSISPLAVAVVIIGFTGLTSLYSSVSLSNLGFIWLHSVNVSVSSESLCSPRFNSVYFSVNSSVIFTRLIFGLRTLKST